MKIKKILFTCFTFILLFNIGLTNAKYASLEYGDIFNVKLSKYTTNVEFEIDKDTEKMNQEKILTGKVRTYGGLENHQMEMLMAGLKVKTIHLLNLNQ